MKILVCPDSFKGTLTAKEAALAIKAGIKAEFPETTLMPMADGGYGTLDVIHEDANADAVYKQVKGPLGEEIEAKYLILNKKTAFIEMAQAAGLVLIPENQRNPLLTTTYGVGELILDALERGCKEIFIGIGGSSTNDGGMGMAQALGAKFYDKDNKEVEFRKEQGYAGGSLKHINKIDISNINKKITSARFVIASDVANPLTGKNGASYVYGPQKGATPKVVKELDNSLKHYANIIKRDLKKDVLNRQGAGAAGGLGAGILAFLNAEMKSGVKVVIELIKFEDHVKECDLIITGEGRIDGQTAHGKTINGIAEIAKKHQKPVIALGGCLGRDYRKVYDIGVDVVYDVSQGSIEATMVTTKAH